MTSFTGVAAAPIVGDGGDVAYTEQADPTQIGHGVTVTSESDSSYGGGRVDFAVSDAKASESLSLKEDDAPVVTAGVVSIVAGTVYLGNGDTADVIGGVDPGLDGANGNALRVNFESPFVNPSFEDGTTVGWTTMEQWVDLGATVIAGYPSVDTSNYSILTSGGAAAPANDDRAPAPTGAYGVPVWTTETTGEDARHGAYSLRLQSTMTTAGPCDIVHGPAAYSSPFEAAGDDKIYFDWKAFASEDYGHVFGYIVNVATGMQTEVLDTVASSGTSTWAEVETTIPADGTYRFVFVSGTFDYTCGTKAGASLLIDNVRVFGSKVKDNVVDALVGALQYQNVSDDPPASRSVTVVAADNTGGVDSGTITVNITAVDDPPALDPVAGIEFTNTDGSQVFGAASGTLAGHDLDDDIVYGVTGAVSDATTIAGTAYTHSREGSYGTLHVNSAIGDYAFVPNDGAIDGQLKTAAETYTFVATAGALSAPQTFTVGVSVDVTVASAPVLASAEPSGGQVDLTWSAPTWIGGSDITGYRIEQSLDAGNTWTVARANTETAGTAHTVTGLTNGMPVAFRVLAINAAGTSLPSNDLEATPLTVPSVVTITGVVSTNRTLTVSFLPPSDDGGAAITGYQYSLDGGSTWTTAATTSGTLVIDGLVNQTRYNLQMRAVNAAGEGLQGTPLPSAPALIPVPTDSGTPGVAPGTSELVIDGVPAPVSATAANGTWTAAGAGFTVELEGVSADGDTLAIDDQGRLVSIQGGSMTVRGTGFRAGSMVDVWLLTGAHLLGEATVAQDGSFSRTFALPSGVNPGTNTIQLNGVSDSGALRSLSTGLVVLAAPVSAELAITGATPAGALALALLLVSVGVALMRVGLRKRVLHRV